MTEKTSHPLSSTGDRLLRMAESVSRDRIAMGSDGEGPSALSEFVQTYREWITGNRGRMGTQQEQAEAWQLICHAMITAKDIDEAIHLLIRFGKVIWGERGPSDLREKEDMAVLTFCEPWDPGPEGLIASIWQLALTLCELEFLSGSTFHGATGGVIHERILPEGITRLLFAGSLEFGGGEVCLSFPKSYLRRPVVTRPDDLPEFFRKLLPLTLGAGRASPSIRTMVVGLIRDDKLGPDMRETSLENVAGRLGMSVPTLGRRLKEEGTSFRAVKEEVYMALARSWLSQADMPVSDIAARLGFSDTFAFRRFFKRVSDVSPSAFRQEVRR